MKQEAEANAEADKAAKEKVDKLNEADAMIFQTESQMKEFGDKLPEDKKKPIEDALAELKEAHKTGDVEKITPALEKLNEEWTKVSEEMYKAQAEAQGGQAGPSGNGQAGPDANADSGSDSKDDVEDVDFEEVK
jgi:molecular chaperone DnaK